MKIKCHNCNHECREGDIFCSYCGNKLTDDTKNIINEEKLDKAQEKAIEVIQSYPVEEVKLSFAKKNFSQNPVFNFALIFIVISFILSALLHLFIQKQTSQRLSLQFKNMINNPSLIPELTQPGSFDGLAKNLSEVENFLLLYLRYSKDSAQKKDKVFISYLKELDKLQNFNSDSLTLSNDGICSNVKDMSGSIKCANKLNKIYEKVGINAFSGFNATYLYPDYKFILEKYSKYLSSDLLKYVQMRAKYNYPVVLGLDIYIKPAVLADKIFDYEELLNKTQDEYLKDEISRILYNDFRTFIFLPSIYATTTHEMKSNFKSAYKKFISKHPESQLSPVLMSYIDKQKDYQEENFKNDYPYKIFTGTFEENVASSNLQDVFLQLRKKIFSEKTQYSFTYVYNIIHSSWRIYNPSQPVGQGEYAFSAQDENNNIYIYNNTFSPLQELNVSKYAKLYLINGVLCLFNSNKLNLSRVVFNGKKFYFQQMNSSDITSLFPGIEVIYIDSYQDYNIFVEKDNKNAAFIILSRYAQGFDGYEVTSQKGSIVRHSLPNMFLVSSLEDTVVMFKNSSVNTQETSDLTPAFKITIHTRGYQGAAVNDVVKYDEQTANEENQTHNPNIMPKIQPEENKIEKDAKENFESREEYMPQNAPSQRLEPPNDDE